VSKVLFVDDDSNVLTGMQRQFRKRFELETADGGKQGLQILASQAPFSVVVSDFRMPEMNGVEFLSQVQEESPETVCIMLTGQSDVTLVMDAVNKNEIFRFLTKPCPPEILGSAIDSAISQYELQQAEKEILTETLTGCLAAMTEILSLVNPEAFGRTSRIQRRVQRIAEQLGMSEDWNLEISSMLSQVGCVSVPPQVIKKFYAGEPLTKEEQNLFLQYPSVGANLIEHIPRMEKVAQIIRFQEKHYSESAPSQDKSDSDEEVPIGAHILKVALDYDFLESSNLSSQESLKILEGRPERYNPSVLNALKASFKDEKPYRLESLEAHELEPKMIVVEEIMDKTGQLIVAKGQELSPFSIQQIRYNRMTKTLMQSIKVVIPN